MTLSSNTDDMGRWPGEPESVDDHFDTMLAREAEEMDKLVDELERRTRQTTKSRHRKNLPARERRRINKRRRGW